MARRKGGGGGRGGGGGGGISIESQRKGLEQELFDAQAMRTNAWNELNAIGADLTHNYPISAVSRAADLKALNLKTGDTILTRGGFMYKVVGTQRGAPVFRPVAVRGGAGAYKRLSAGEMAKIIDSRNNLAYIIPNKRAAAAVREQLRYNKASKRYDAIQRRLNQLQ